MSEDGGSGFVGAAMRDGGVKELDARGLVPLDEARALVRGSTDFRKGQGRMVGGSWVLDSDRLWAALMSLEDTAEFVREATRIRWSFHPRGKDNVAPIERYGPGVEPWLRHFVLQNGVLIDVPWCVLPCLQQLADPSIFDLLWGVRHVHGASDDAWPGPFAPEQPGDVEVDRAALSALPRGEPDGAAIDVVIDWVYAQPEVGFVELARRAEGADARAQRLLRSLAEVDPEEAFGWAAQGLGAERARAAFAAARAPTEIDERAIVAMLDNAVSVGWPQLFGDPCYHALRLIAARERGGTGWGVVFERIEGASPDGAGVRPYLAGSRVFPGARDAERPLPLFEEEPEGGAPGSLVVGPAGPLLVDDALIARLDLRPDAATGPEVASTRFSVLVRAYLAVHPDALWTPVEEAVQWLGLGEDPEVVAVSTAFEHTVGPKGPDAYPPSWRLRPSASPVYRSLARALMERSPAPFEPGESNLSFRLHALAAPAGP